MKLRTINVLICDDQEPIVEMIGELVEDIVSEKTVVNLFAAISDSQLIEIANTKRFDLFVLTLNNIIYKLEKFTVFSKPDQALALLLFLKATYNVPIICLYGNPDNDAYAQIAIKAGADSAMRIPCELRKIREAFRRCLLL